MAKENEKQRKMKGKFRNFMNLEDGKLWNYAGNIGKFISMFGWISILTVSVNYCKNQKMEKAERLRNDAISIFNGAYDISNYQEALKLFLEAKKRHPNNLTGYNLFLELAKEKNEEIMIFNDSIYKYDNIIELYFQYADSLNDSPINEAKTKLEELKQLKIYQNDKE